MSAPARSVGLAVALAAAAALAGRLAYGPHAAELTVVILAPLGAATVLAAHVLVARRGRIGSLRRQFSLVALLVVGQLAAGVALFVAIMFVSAHDAYFTALLMLYAAILGAWSVHLLARPALRDVERVRSTLAAVGEGRRDVRTGIRQRPAPDELARLAADVDVMVERLQTVEDARRTLLAAVSHDLRTPITSLQLLSEAIDDEIVDSATRGEYVARIGTHVRALSALIDDLFELTRLEAGDIRWSIERVRLDELVQETVDAMRVQADARAVAVHAELPPGLASARANPEQLQRVLFNLIQNAIRHTPADGSVVVRAEAGRDGGVEIEVADTGEGIAAHDRDRVFEAFFRGGTRAARTDGGSGLGLAISRAIIEAHGGRIWLADAPRGTRVRFSLPPARQHSGDGPRSAAAAFSTPAS